MDPAGIFGGPRAWTRRLLGCGVAAGPVFVVVFVAEGAVRDGYRPLRHPVSSLALGPRGWIQAGNFPVAGTLFGAGFGQSPRLVNLAGLFQRASIITGFSWLTALSAQALRRMPAAAAPPRRT